MMRRGLLLLPVCLVLALSVGIAQSGDKKEQEKLEGTWSAVKFSGGNKKSDHPKDMKVTFKGDKITMKGGEKKMEAKYSVDPTKKPKTMDLHIEMGDKKATLHGIYDLDGDNLKIAHYEGEKATKGQPTDFTPSDDVVVAVFKRDKK